MSRRATKNLSWDEWLTAWWGRTKHDGADLHFSGPRSPDRHYLYRALCMRQRDERGAFTVPSIIEELERRGYDTTTLEFRIKRKDGANG